MTEGTAHAPATAPPQTPPINLLVLFSVLIDSAGLAKLAGLLKTVLGDVQFVAKGDTQRQTGDTIESVSAKEHFGNGSIRELWIIQKGGSYGVYFEGGGVNQIRLFLPPGANAVSDDILKLLLLYRSPYWFFVGQKLDAMAFTFILAPYFAGVLLSYLIFKQNALVESIRGYFGKSTSGTAAFSWLGLLLSFGIGYASGYVLRFLLWPVRGLWNFAFPKIALDVPANVGRNDTARWFRRALIAFPLGALVKGIIS